MLYMAIWASLLGGAFFSEHSSLHDIILNEFDSSWTKIYFNY
jgi:hypothetical protein